MKSLLLSLLICLNPLLTNKVKIIAPAKFGERPNTIVYLPKHYSENLPLVILLHGHGANGMIGDFYLPFKDLVDPMNFIIAIPTGTRDSEKHRFWNDGLLNLDFIHKHKGVQQPNTDDIGFLDNLIQTLKARYPIDPSKIYLIGHSNGAFMSYRYACAPKSQIAAIVTIAGSITPKLECHHHFSILHIHGTADKVIKFTGDPNYFSVKENINFWKEYGKCAPEASQENSKDILSFHFGADTTQTCWNQCSNQTEICLYQLNGAGHIPIFKKNFRKELLNFLFSN